MKEDKQGIKVSEQERGNIVSDKNAYYLSILIHFKDTSSHALSCTFQKYSRRIGIRE